MKVVSRGMMLACLLGAALGCADGRSATEPMEEHPAIPQFAAAQCAVWSCSEGDCQQDPAYYGACCVEAATAEYPAQPAPSCSGPRNGVYCQQFPTRCASGENTTNLNPPNYCYHANPSQICADQSGCNALEGPAKEACLAGCSNASMSDYPECFSDGDPNS